jgi:predicted transcriptional regulator
MSESTNRPSTGTPASAQLRTLAVRITEDLRAQLDIIAQLTGRSTTEEIRLALEHCPAPNIINTQSPETA